MEFEENNVEIEGNSTRNLKKKHKEFLTRVILLDNPDSIIAFLLKKNRVKNLNLRIKKE